MDTIRGIVYRAFRSSHGGGDPMTVKMAMLALCAAAAAFTLAGCQSKASNGNPEPEEEKPVSGAVVISKTSPLRSKLAIEVVEQRPIRPQLLAPASIEADPARLAKVAPPLTGQVRQLLVRQGDLVEKGQPLFVIDAPDLVSARADVLRARTVLVQTDQALRRAQDLLVHSVAAQRDVEEAQAARDVARDDLRRAEQRLRLLGIQSADVEAPLVVRSPLAGQVLSLATAPGEFRNDPTTPLLVVADLSTLWVTASVPERDTARVHPHDDASVTVAAFPNRQFFGRVLHIENVLDPDTRTVKVRIQLDNPRALLKPGMFATVTFFGSPEQGIVVPTTALLVGDSTYVWVETAPWTFVKRPVQLAS
ncbi:MAG TPA: efflux RND transporter periplasmic adaptor subunit, partial [Thermoanaerobaculia bacterium]|nr:efflux RND transporter periplasmic adaptor subunit [Thermoanaerobaculia bacterium]